MKTHSKKLPRKLLIVASAAAFVMLAGSQATAFSIGHSDYEGRDGSDQHQGAHGMRWWSLFQGKQPRHRAREENSAPERSIGDWLDLQYPRRDDVIDEIINTGSIAQTGIDGRARLSQFKKKFLKGIMLVLRFKRHLFAHHDHEPEPVPLPAPILLLGSSLAALMAFRRRGTARIGRSVRDSAIARTQWREVKA